MKDSWVAVLRQGCAEALAAQDRVRVDRSAIVAVANQRVGADDLRSPTWAVPGDPGSDPEALAAWLLAYNAMNFSYYPEPGCVRWAALVDGEVVGRDDEALGVMASLGAAARHGEPMADGDHLAEMGAADLERLLPTAPGHGPLPMAAERLRGLKELGRAYQRHGGPLGLLASGRGDAVLLVDALVKAMPGWEDVRSLGGRQLPFRKRAQLCVAMLHARERAAGRAGMTGMSQLTVFADYRLPQILRGEGALLLAGDLAARIQAGEPLARNAPDEAAIRAATVVAADELVAALRPRFPFVDALLVDNLLWRRAVEQGDALPAFHRTRCTDY